MTPLDRFFLKFPVLKNIVFWIDDNLVFIVVIPIFLFILFIFYWALVLAPRKAGRIIKNLVRKGYNPVQSDDSRLVSAIEKLTPIMYHAYKLSTVTNTTPWSADAAYENRSGWSDRFFAHIKRSVSRNPPGGGYEVRSEFTIAFYESRALPFAQDIYIAGDKSRLDQGYGLHQVEDEALGPLSSLYVFHTSEGKLGSLPPRLIEALMDCAPILSISAEQDRKNYPFLFHARIRFTPEGWGFISNEFVYHQEKMDALVEAVNLISRSLR